ncbi:hypothetical protein [Undibacterium danionis]|uniref:DUF5648 domain-containing protein n=1 Tax=Undibacterium danionis TaxID=1812100 RepID=A0ABV6IBT9_9BURK
MKNKLATTISLFCAAFASFGVNAQDNLGDQVYRVYLSKHVAFETNNFQEAQNNRIWSAALNLAWQSVGKNNSSGGVLSVPVYRCVILNSYKGQEHFASRDFNCEGQTREGIYGYVYPVQVLGTVPLFRVYAHNNEYGVSSHATFDSEVKFTQSALNYDQAWYSREGTIGYVYPSPAW